MAGSFITFGAFKKLLGKDEFIDFFNKFTCLPAFAQLVAYSRRRKKFILHPPLPNRYTVNDSGLIEWLWRKRLNLFLKSIFFGEYRICSSLIHHSLIKETGDALKTEKAREVRHALRWLQRKCLGRVSQIRKFRKFLNATSDGSKLYQYWLDSEHLYFHVKRRSSVSNSMELLNVIKEKYFVKNDESKIPHHLLEMARQNLLEPNRVHDSSTDAKTCDVTFAIYLRRLCADRLRNYWMPRYLLEQNPVVQEDKEIKFHGIAKNYLRGSINLVAEVSSSSESIQIEPEKQDLEGEENSKRHSKVKKSIKELYSSVSSDEDEDDYDKPTDDALSVDTNTKHKEVYFSQLPSPEVPSSSSNYEEEIPDSFDDSSSEDEEEYKKRLKERKARSQRRRAAGRRATGSVKKVPKDENKNSDKPKSKSSKVKSRDKKEKQSSELSDSIDSFEEVHDKYRKKRSEEMKFELEDKQRKKSLHKRKLKFQELLTKQLYGRPAGMSSNAAKLLKKGITNVDSQKILLDDGEEDPRGSFDSGRSSLTPSLKLSSSDMKVDAVGGKALLQAKLNLTPSRMSLRSPDPEGPDSPSRTSLLSEFGKRRISGPNRASYQDSTSSLTEMQSSTSKLRVFAKRKRKRKKVTTFRLSEIIPNSFVKSIGTKFVKSDKKKCKQGKSEKIRMSLSPPKSISLPEITLPPVAFSNEYSLSQDNAYRSRPENKRMVLALQADQCASQPFRNFLLSTDNHAELVSCLGFWQDVEKTRQDFQFGTMTFSSFLLSIRGVVDLYLLPSAPCHIEVPEILRKEAITNCRSPEMQEMPWQIRKLQRDVMEDLKEAYETFCQHETQSFLIAVSFRKDSAEPNSAVQKSEGFFPPIITQKIPEEEVEVDDEIYKSELESRMSRSLRYVIEIDMPVGRDSNPAEEISDESDDDGSAAPPPPPTYVREPSPDFKELASRSWRQYPDTTHPAGVPHTLKVFLERATPSSPRHGLIIRGGEIVKRPLGRPKNFQEVLYDGHFQFFKKFLKSHRANVPLNFWDAVEKLRAADNMRFRQMKAAQIIKKYFHDTHLPAARFLQCSADLIKDIPYYEVVTTSMLFSAQAIIARVLEERWFKRYADTFEENTSPSPVKICVTNLKKSSLSKDGRLPKMWSVLSDFIRRSVSFLRSMRKPHLFDMFEKFLRRENDSERIAESVLPVDLLSNRSESTIFPSLYRRNEEKSGGMNQKIINGQVILFDFLSNDLHFWRDIECYRTMTRAITFEKSYEEELETLREKANLIVSCYLESSIQPRMRVNIPAEVAEITVESLRNGLVDKGLFHEATVYVFPLLIHFWKKFCKEYYRYVPSLSKKHRLIYGLKMTPAIAKQLQNKKKGIIDASQQHGDATPANKKNKKNSQRIDSADLPNYLEMEEKNIVRKIGSPVPVGNDEVCPRLTFSIRTGATLFEPGRRRRRTTLKIRNFFSTAERPLYVNSPPLLKKRSIDVPVRERCGNRTSLFDASLLQQFTEKAKVFFEDYDY